MKLNQTPQTDEIPSELLTKLSSKKLEEREKAQQAIEEMGDAAADRLMQAIDREAQKRKKRVKIYTVIISVWVGFMILMAATGYADQIGSFTGMFGAFASFYAVSQQQKNAATELAKLRPKRAVGQLADALEYGDKNMRMLASSALQDILPQLQASDDHLMNAEQRSKLYNVLKRARFKQDTLLMVAILKALEQIGDEKALPMVENLSKIEPRNGMERSVKAAALECLPALTERVEKQRRAQTLLRPAAAPDNPAEVLLRPVHGAAPGDPEKLLRPSQPE
jgi:hypothetical protein